MSPVPEPREWPAELHVRERGEGRPIVFVHGQPGTAADFSAVERLLSQDFKTLRYDRPGWGKSELSPTGLAANAAVLGDLLELAASPPLVVGYSFGAAVGVLAARQHPEAVGGLVLVCPAVGPESLGALDRVMAAPRLAEGLAIGGFALGAWVLDLVDRHGSVFPGPVSQRLAPLASSGISRVLVSGRHPWKAFVTEQRALLAEMEAVEASLGELAVPTVLIGGRRDRAVPPAAVEAAAARIGHAELAFLEGGHLLPWSAPYALARLIASAAANLDAGRAAGPGARDPLGDLYRKRPRPR